MDVRIGRFPFRANARAITNEDTEGLVKFVADAQTDRILGAHLLGEHAEEVINVFALAIRANLSATDLKHTIYSYPTSSSDIVYML